jgi:hypothetical protein
VAKYELTLALFKREGELLLACTRQQTCDDWQMRATLADSCSLAAETAVVAGECARTERTNVACKKVVDDERMRS